MMNFRRARLAILASITLAAAPLDADARALAHHPKKPVAAHVGVLRGSSSPTTININGLPAGSTPATGAENIPLSQQNPLTGVYSTVRLQLSQLLSYVGAGLLQSANNLSDVANLATARTNLFPSNTFTLSQFPQAPSMALLGNSGSGISNVGAGSSGGGYSASSQDPTLAAVHGTINTNDAACYNDANGTLRDCGVGSIDASFFEGFIGGLQLSNDATTPNTVIDIGSGSATASTAAGQPPPQMMRTAGINKSLASTWAAGSGSSFGCLDVGAIGASLWYHIFLIERLDTFVVDALCSLTEINVGPATISNASPAVVTIAQHGQQIGSQVSFAGTLGSPLVAGQTYYLIAAGFQTGQFEIASTQGGAAINTSGASSNVTATFNPNLPANYTIERHIGSIKTDSSSHILGFFQHTNEFLWNIATLDYNSTIGTGVTAIPLNVPLGAHVNALIGGYCELAAANVNAYIYNPSVTTPAMTCIGPTAGAFGGFNTNVKTNLSAVVDATSSSASTNLYLETFGWIDTRGSQ